MTDAAPKHAEANGLAKGQERLSNAFNLGKAAGSAMASVIAQQAQASFTEAVEKGKEAVAQIQAKAAPPPVPCATCGLPTKAGDGGSCGDAQDMSRSIAAPTAETGQPPVVQSRCRSCLTLSEIELVKQAAIRYNTRLHSFHLGEEEQVYDDPKEGKAEMAHRLGSLALEGLSKVVDWCPLAPKGLSMGVQAIHGIVKYGPLAIYSNEALEAVQLLATLASRSGVVRTKSGTEVSTGSVLQGGTSLSQAAETVSDVKEMSICLYYILLERRNAVGLDPNMSKRQHAHCPSVDIQVLKELSDFFTFASPIAYASSPAEAQRQLRLLRGSWQMVLAEPAGPGGRPPFILAADRQAKKAAVLIPGTQEPADAVTDLRALPVRLDLGPGSKPGWAHRGMLRQACAIARDLGSTLEQLEKDGYDVVLVGHSLGAAVSALAGAIVRLGLEGPKVARVRSLCFATPACCNVALAKFCEAHTISVFNEDDVVPRLSIETARRLRAELETRREITRVYLKEDMDALKNVQNITEKKRRVHVDDAPDVVRDLASLDIPAPQPEVEAAEEKRAADAAKVEADRAARAAAKAKPKPKRRGFCLCGTVQSTEDTDGEENAAKEPGPPEPEEPEAPETDDPAEVWLFPPGRLIHLYRHCGARRAAWVKRTHPTLHHIEVLTGVADGHKGVSYKQGLEEACFAAQGLAPVQWKAFGQVFCCACCKSDFAWASVLRSEPHRLQSRHHCHSCGDVVCDSCSQNKRPLPNAGIMREVRVCDRCFLNAGAPQSGVAS